MKKVFFVDFDDTLIERQPDPTNFRLPDFLIRLAMMSLESRNIFIVVTGRSVEQIDSFFYPVKLDIIGCHGNQIRLGNKMSGQGVVIPDGLRLQLEGFALDLECAYEDKRYSFTIHDARENTRNAMADILLQWDEAYEVKLFGGCMEIVPIGASKGKAMRDVMRNLHCGIGDDIKFVYIGDDAATDKSLQRLESEGLDLVRVGAASSDGCFWLADPGAVRTFLLGKFSV